MESYSLRVLAISPPRSHWEDETCMDMPVTHTLAAQRAAIRALLYTNETDVARSLVE